MSTFQQAQYQYQEYTRQSLKNIPNFKRQMKHQKISNKYSKWIIEFHSDNFSKPIYFLWLTDHSDKNEQDLILTNKSDEIIVEESKRKLIKKILKHENSLPDNLSMEKWLKKSSKCNTLFATKYDCRGIAKKINNKNIKSKEIETIVNIINLLEDYDYQIHLDSAKIRSRTKRLNIIWNYYYDQIFWPNFNKTNPLKYKLSELEINHNKLSKEFVKLVRRFEKHFDK